MRGQCAGAMCMSNKKAILCYTQVSRIEHTAFGLGHFDIDGVFSTTCNIVRGLCIE